MSNDEPITGELRFSVESSADIIIEHTHGWNWESRWTLLKETYNRIANFYGGSSVASNTDLWALTNSFMIDAFHLREALADHLDDSSAVKAVVDQSPALKLCRDYANTWKHVKRERTNYRLVEIHSTTFFAQGGGSVCLRSGTITQPLEERTRHDLLQVADEAMGCWRQFIQSVAPTADHG